MIVTSASNIVFFDTLEERVVVWKVITGKSCRYGMEEYRLQKRLDHKCVPKVVSDMLRIGHGRDIVMFASEFFRYPLLSEIAALPDAQADAINRQVDDFAEYVESIPIQSWGLDSLVCEENDVPAFLAETIPDIYLFGRLKTILDFDRANFAWDGSRLVFLDYGRHDRPWPDCVEWLKGHVNSLRESRLEHGSTKED